jgi:geranylgeranyl reductase
MIETDMLIVGGGVAGATLARYLADADVEHIIVQRNLTYKKPCGGGIRLDAFDEFDIDKTLIKKYVDEIYFVHKTKRIKLDISKYPIGIVDRVEFDMALRQKAKDVGSVLYEASFVDIEVFDEFAISTIKKGSEYIKIKSNYVVASDGVNSKLRKLINGDMVDANLTQYCDLDSLECNVCEFHLGSRVAGRYYSWVFPHAKGSNIGTVSDAKNNHIKGFLESLSIKKYPKILGFKIPNFKNNIFYKNRVFFLGDSASQVLPFTYEGIYYAMSSAKILSNIIINKQPPQDYEKEWNKKYLTKFNTLLKLQNIFLKNDFMIMIVMQLFQNNYIKEQIIKFWLGKREVKVDFAFFMRVFKHIK